MQNIVDEYMFDPHWKKYMNRNGGLGTGFMEYCEDVMVSWEKFPIIHKGNLQEMWDEFTANPMWKRYMELKGLGTGFMKWSQKMLASFDQDYENDINNNAIEL